MGWSGVSAGGGSWRGGREKGGSSTSNVLVFAHLRLAVSKFRRVRREPFQAVEQQVRRGRDSHCGVRMSWSLLIQGCRYPNSDACKRVLVSGPAWRGALREACAESSKICPSRSKKNRRQRWSRWGVHGGLGTFEDSGADLRRGPSASLPPASGLPLRSRPLRASRGLGRGRGLQNV